MRTLLDADVRESFCRRVAALHPGTPARWGKFNTPRMLAQVIQSVGMMTGDVTVADAPTPWVMRHAPLRQLLIYVLPFPKGLPTAPELLERTAASDGVSPTEWSDELRAFEHALGRIPDVARTGRWPAHPAFGPLSGHQSAALQRRHLEHHFRQFAV